MPDSLRRLRRPIIGWPPTSTRLRYSPTHKKIGAVDDLILTSSGQINKAVIGVGGFLGVGQKEVVVPFADLKIVAQKGAQELVLDRTKEQLKSAPSYDKTAMK